MAGTARFVNMQKVEQALMEAFADWAENDVNKRYWREQFEDDWRYPGPPTVRKAKPPAGNPRDILDTEALYESGVKSFTLSETFNGIRADWHWNAKNFSGEEYAWYVHEGQGPYARVARPWTDEMAHPFQFETSDIKLDLIRAIDEHLNNGRFY